MSSVPCRSVPSDVQSFQVWPLSPLPDSLGYFLASCYDKRFQIHHAHFLPPTRIQSFLKGSLVLSSMSSHLLATLAPDASWDLLSPSGWAVPCTSSQGVKETGIWMGWGGGGGTSGRSYFAPTKLTERKTPQTRGAGRVRWQLPKARSPHISLPL